MTNLKNIILNDPTTQVALGATVASLVVGVALYRISLQVQSVHLLYGAYGAAGLPPAILLAGKAFRESPHPSVGYREVKRSFISPDMRDVRADQISDILYHEFARVAGKANRESVAPVYTVVFRSGTGHKAFDIRELCPKAVLDSDEALGNLGLTYHLQQVRSAIRARNSELLRLVHASNLLAVIQDWRRALKSTDLIELTGWVDAIKDPHVRDLVRWAPVQMAVEQAPVTPEAPIGVCLGAIEAEIADMTSSMLEQAAVAEFLDQLVIQLQNPLSLAAQPA